jgi:hypothetical protein
MSPNRKVYLTEEQVYADLISEGLYVSRVQYSYGGVLFDIFVENDEFVLLEEEDESLWENEESAEEQE